MRIVSAADKNTILTQFNSPESGNKTESHIVNRTSTRTRDERENQSERKNCLLAFPQKTQKGEQKQ